MEIKGRLVRARGWSDAHTGVRANEIVDALSSIRQELRQVHTRVEEVQTGVAAVHTDVKQVRRDLLTWPAVAMALALVVLALAAALAGTRMGHRSDLALEYAQFTQFAPLSHSPQSPQSPQSANLPPSLAPATKTQGALPPATKASQRRSPRQ
jgi:hypothetical protein